VTGVLSWYFTDKIDADKLWLELRSLKEKFSEDAIKDAQSRFIDVLSLGKNNIDFEKCKKGILICETLKDQNQYSELELYLNGIEKVRRQYGEEKENAFDSLKERYRSKLAATVQQLAQQAGNKNMTVDIEGSLEASVKASPEWKSFLSDHDEAFNEQFNVSIDKIRNLVN
jgi:hypothetical protein